MNLVDVFAIIPFYLTLWLNSLEDLTIIGKAGKLIRLIRVLRIMRIFKLVRHFAGLQSLIYTLHQAYKELGLLMLLGSLIPFDHYVNPTVVKQKGNTAVSRTSEPHCVPPR